MKFCKEENCTKSPGFNYEGKKERLYCSLHKKDGMVDIKTKKCIEASCEKQPSCNFADQKKAIYCFDHKKENMINVFSKRCREEKCNRIPMYNFPGCITRLYCAEHKNESMIDLVHKTCIDEKCDKRPNYNYEGEKSGILCKAHSKQDMVDVIHPKCKECNITRTSNKRYKELCLRCFMFKYPDEKATKNYKIKENHMVDFIKNEFGKENLIFDKQVDGGCSKRRPDCYIDKLTHILVIECDENQHNGYEGNCENKRVMQLFQDFGSRPVVFIRFNPDSYKSKGTKVKSCFEIHKVHGIPIIDEKSNWKHRLNVLKDTIRRWIKEVPTQEVTSAFLFFDSV
jgi:hypothetical protein